MAKQKSKADYRFELREAHGIKFLLIEDQDLGNVSVTNDIENVVSEIGEEEDITDRVILYCDSDGRWDGWSKAKGFFPVGGHSDFNAMQLYAKTVES